mmetsp:Transcript_57456/g.163717  ORF Transcript_57456/g.163717 Transcript_57456/m.163717 type:complete len:240 (-) Transcript_57456:500-1219(-)
MPLTADRSGAGAAPPPLTATRSRPGAQRAALEKGPPPRRPRPRPSPVCRRPRRAARRRHHLRVLVAMGSGRGSRRPISTPSFRTSTMPLARERTSSRTPRSCRQLRRSPASPILATSRRISWSLPHSWDRRATKRQGDGQRPRAGLRRGATASRRSEDARPALARAIVPLAIRAKAKASTALVRLDRLTRAAGPYSSAGITTTVLSASTCSATPPCSSTTHPRWPQTPRSHTRLGSGSG